MNREWGILSKTDGVRTWGFAVKVHCTTNYASTACEETGSSNLKLVNYVFTVGCFMWEKRKKKEGNCPRVLSTKIYALKLEEGSQGSVREIGGV